MEELIARIVEKVGIGQDTASTALGVILKFMQDEVPADLFARISQFIPGAADAAQAQADSQPAGGLGGLLGGLLGGGAGGMISTVTSLTNAGLGMGQIQDLAKEVLTFAEEKAGPGIVQEIMGAIPQLKMFGQ